jgi:hypothetical protein
MAFAQGRTVRPKDQRVVSKKRGLPAQRLIEKDLSRCVGEMVFPPDDMRHVHRVVIDDARKIISGHPIRPDDDEIADSRRIEIHFSMDEIVKKNRPSSDVKPNNRVEARRFHSGDLCGREGAAAPVIAGHRSPGELFLPKFFESFLRAKTLITFSFLR